MAYSILVFILGAMFGACALSWVGCVIQKVEDWRPAAVWTVGLFILTAVIALRHG